MQWAFGAIGWSPEEFWSATPIELKHAIQGWKASNGIAEETNDSGQPILSKSEVDELKEMMEEADRGNR